MNIISKKTFLLMGIGNSIKRLSQSLGLLKDDEDHKDDSIDFSKLQESEDSDSASESDSSDENRPEQQGEAEDSEKNPDSEEDEDIALSEVELDDDADVIPHQRTTINNVGALKRSLSSIELPRESQGNFMETFSVTNAEPLTVKDVFDDTERELAFYAQALEAVRQGRNLCKQKQIPFSRPADYFAEMVKSDEHMDRIKRKLIDEETAKRASQEARKQRELKKYGKKVQHERLQQYQKQKRDTLDKVNSLKRKRKNQEVPGGDEFEVHLEDALKDKKKERDDKYRLGNRAPNNKRQAKNNKYGYGGKKKGSRSNTAESSMDISGFQNKRRRK